MTLKISPEAREEAQKRVQDAVQRWERAVTSGDVTRFVREQRSAQKQMEEDFTNTKNRVEEELRRGARRNSGRIF